MIKNFILKQMRLTTSVFTILFLAGLNCSSSRTPEPGSTIEAVITIKGTGTPIQTRAIYSVPPQYDQDIPAPLLIALHGYGANAAAFHDLWKPVTDSLGFVLLTPQGDIPLGGNFSWSWSGNAEKIVLASLDVVRKHVFIHPTEIYLAGFSMGGSLSYHIGLKHPKIFHGIAALGAPFDAHEIPQISGRTNDMKVYIGHGELDNHLEEARNAYALLSEKGMDVQLQIYPETGHTLPEPMREELVRILNFLQSGKSN